MRLARRFLLPIVVLSLLAALPRSAGACMVDAVPSATALSRTAILYDVVSNSIDPAHYAPFVFPDLYGVGWPIRFGELAWGLTLPTGELHAPWQWRFGDGAVAWGHSVTHIYRRSGAYVITVAAQVHGEPFPFLFDRILLHVIAPGQLLPAEGANLLDGSRFATGAPLLGGLLPLRRVADKGLVDIASQVLAQIEDGAWASIKDYWHYTRGNLPPAYARVNALLRREGAALSAHNQHQAATIADALPAAWARARSS